MKNLLLCLLWQILLCHFCESQILCIKCFDQNEEISAGVNNLVLNGGFENSNCTPGWLGSSYCPNSSHYDCDLEHWLCTDGDVQSYPSVFDTTLSLIPEGQNAAYFGNGNAFTCSDFWNDFSCMTFTACTVSGFPSGFPKSLEGYGGPTGVSLEQTISSLTIGHTYVLEFWAGGEPLQGLLSSNGIFAVDVGFGLTYLTCKPTDESHFPIGSVYLIEFNATSTSHKIKFTNWGHVCTDCTELVIDNVRLYTIEELSNAIEPCIMSSDQPVEQVMFDINPSPFHDELSIVSSVQQSVTFYLFNSLSGKVLQVEVTGSAVLNTNQLDNGIYFYEFRNKNELLQSGKLVKQ